MADRNWWYERGKSVETRECLTCGQTFTAASGEVRRGRGRYCTLYCSNNRPRTIEERFWKKVNKNGPLPEHHPEFGRCWPWTGAKRFDGYGTFLVNAKRTDKHISSSHRVAWTMASGETITADDVIGHVCDTPLCVRNDELGIYIVNGKELPRWGHLFLGNAEDNRLDMMSKGRAWAPHGEDAGPSKLTEAQVAEIRRQAVAGRLQREIAADFGTTQPNISCILRGVSWKH